MFNTYSDITEMIAQPPLWWDEHGVPRYAAFQPPLIADIYAREAVLLQIACSCCRARFEVACTSPGLKGQPDRRDLAESIEKREISYGDPPNSGHCNDGASSSCYDLRVLQYWSRPSGSGEWVRDSRFEVDLPDLIIFGGLGPVESVS